MKLLHDTTVLNTIIIYVSKLAEYLVDIIRVYSNVNYGLWIVKVASCGFISTGKCIMFVGHIGMCRARKHVGKLRLFHSVCYEPNML